MDKGYVLVVDDEPSARAALAELLRDEGYRVETAADAMSALGKLQQGDVDILLTDLKMPGMDGVELLRQLRTVYDGGVVAVVMTAYGAVDTAVSAMKEGATDYITKPVHMAELIPALERGMARRRLLHEAEQARLTLEAANRDLEAFARRVAHDLRTPLMPITLMAGSLKLQSLDPKVVRTADRIVGSVHQVSDMIEDLLTFSRLGRDAEGQVTDAAAVVRQSLDAFVEQIADDQVTVETDVDAGTAVRCSAGLFRQIVDNLVGNALKHVKGREQRSIQVRLSGGDGLVELEVRDSGPGIPPASLGRIFEPFYRVPGNAAPGTGLGLATVRRIVDAHGGQITVRSLVGEGTSFRARLPAPMIAEADGKAAPGRSAER